MREFVTRFCAKPRTHLTVNGETLSWYETTLKQPLPTAVREWYLLIRDIGDYWTKQDSMWIPINPIIDGALISLMAENQNCFRMGYLVDNSDQTDPSVYRYSDGEPDFQLSSTVMEFAIQMLILETIWSGTNAYFDCDEGIGGKEARAIETEFKGCAINDMNLWSAPIRFRCDDDVVFRLDYDGGTDEYAYYGFVAATDDAFNMTVSRLSQLGIELVSH